MSDLSERECAADQCRAMGLAVGDVIVGRSSLPDSWEESELTVLWIGEEVAVFCVRTRNSVRPEWLDRGESGSWNLAYREWVKV